MLSSGDGARPLGMLHSVYCLIMATLYSPLPATALCFCDVLLAIMDYVVIESFHSNTCFTCLPHVSETNMLLCS